ncbi:penicillin-binding protein 1C [Rickettsia endosymbiont of Halotydeus destructor]|uniref:penicillin-binding protein 1C n=1 Tax=Rickettsia endosymbiont of Halotydeus destructor TaxID=2996754 RepID=UPI003BB1BDA8
MLYKTKLIITLLTIGIIVYFILPPPLLLHKVSFSQKVFDRHGELMRISLSKDDKYRIYTPLNKIPQQFIEAVLLYEDKYFYSHFGVNPLSLFKAFRSTYLHKERKIGGSTITMQAARIRCGINSGTIPGKIYQIIKAIHLELHYSKNEILEAYLNLIPYGGNIEGVEAASYIYFGRELKNLNLLDILTLAVIPQNPVKRGKNKVSNNIKKARSYLSSKWLETHPQDAIYSNLFNLPIKFNKTKNLPFIAPHFTLDILAQNSSSKDIFTTIDRNLQATLETQIKLYINARKQYGITNAVAMLVDFTSMEVLASVGSANFFDTDIDGQINGTKAYRSPGSTLKPFIYALAFDQSLIHPLTLLKDSSVRYDNYKPENFDSSFAGGMSASESLIKSRNIPVIFLASKLKNPNFYEFLQQAKIAKLQEPGIYGLSIALGAVEINMEELVKLYAMLANLGSYQPLKKLIDSKQGFTSATLLSREASYLTLDILKDTAHPHAYNNIEPGLPIYWKTGTSSSFRDALTVGIFGKYALAVWIGDFKGQVRGTFTGVETAAPLFFNIINTVINKDKEQDLIKGKITGLEITKIPVCADTGDIYNGMCPIKTDTLFIKGKSPIKPSGIYRKILIDRTNGMPACNFIEGQTEYRIVNFWPTDLLSVYKNAGIHLLPKPLAGNYCGNLVNQNYQKPKITSPIKNSVYSIKNGDRIIFAATVDPSVSDIFWFVNDELIATVKPNDPLSWQPKAGEAIIRVIDNAGESDTVKINFKN